MQDRIGVGFCMRTGLSGDDGVEPWRQVRNNPGKLLFQTDPWLK